MQDKKRLAILGTRGIPARHGGFETFAEHLSLFLTKRGWNITVYCQEDGKGPLYETIWRGVRLINIPISISGAKGTILFDLKSTIHAASHESTILTLGYNTALFNVLYRIKRIPNIINMDGIEWKRGKWTLPERCWLIINERLGARLGNHLIADHPEIKKHLCKIVSAEKITVIPYYAEIITKANRQILEQLGLQAKKYILVIARPEPENSILDIVRAYSRKKRNIPLVILGRYLPAVVKYHEEVMESANENVRFLGAIYDKPTVNALRFFSRFYIHGHTVGGTNPSLVEALGAGNAVLAHNNHFNRWVAGEKALYFTDEEECAQQIDKLLKDNFLINQMEEHSREQMILKFTDDKNLLAYENLLMKWLNNNL